MPKDYYGKTDGSYEDEETSSAVSRRFLEHTIAMIGWSKVDPNRPDEVRDRVLEYFKHCETNGMRPTVEGLAFAFDIRRELLQKYAQGAVQGIPSASVEWFRRAYDIVGTQIADYLHNNKINTVAGIFLMKNNYGYKDETVQYVQTDQRFGQLQDQAELIKRIQGSIGGVAGLAEQSGTEQYSQSHPHQGQGEQFAWGETDADGVDSPVIDGRTPDAFMDLLDEAEVVDDD